MKTAIIKYNAGNVQSVMYALDRLGAPYVWTDDEAEIRSADRVIFPGVGEASTAMTYLRQKGLDRLIPTLRQPVLGTCVGMQLMCRHSEENNTTCMGIFDIDVRRFPTLVDTTLVDTTVVDTTVVERPVVNNVVAPDADVAVRNVVNYKVPHTGWNSLTELRGSLVAGLPEGAYVYFVHSYCADVCEHTTAVCHYVRPFSAMLQRDNFYAAQFHAEISGNVGQRILENFLTL